VTPEDINALDDRIELFIRRTVPVIVKEMLMVQEDTCATAKRVRRFWWCLIGVSIGLTAINVPAGILVASRFFAPI